MTSTFFTYQSFVSDGFAFFLLTVNHIHRDGKLCKNYVLYGDAIRVLASSDNKK